MRACMRACVCMCMFLLFLFVGVLQLFICSCFVFVLFVCCCCCCWGFWRGGWGFVLLLCCLLITVSLWVYAWKGQENVHIALSWNRIYFKLLYILVFQSEHWHHASHWVNFVSLLAELQNVCLDEYYHNLSLVRVNGFQLLSENWTAMNKQQQRNKQKRPTTLEIQFWSPLTQHASQLFWTFCSSTDK